MAMMDFPALVTTNIHQVDVEAINWSQWARTGEQQSRFSNVEDDEGLAAIEAVCSLHEVCDYVYWDAVEHQIWLFGLPIIPHADYAVTLLASHGFSKRSHGTLEASDIPFARTLDAAVEIVPGYDAPNIEADSHHLAQRASLRSAAIYDKAMIAISSTCAQRLARSDDWIRISSVVCINFTRRRNEPFLKKRLDISDSHSDIIKFRSRWNAHGRLTVLWELSRSDRFGSVGHYLRSTHHDLDSGTPLLLSPSGAHVIYRGRLTIADDSEEFPNLNDSKIRCTLYLNHQGYSVPRSAEWIVVEIPSSSSLLLDASPDPARTLVTLWPAKLALCKSRTFHQDVKDLGEPSFSEGMDPVARAESWFSDRVTRKQKVQVYLDETNSKARRLQQQPEPDVSDHETLSVIGSTPMPDAVPQDVSGIYPTPSDGLLSQPSETPISYAQQESSPAVAHADQTMVDYVDSEYHDTRNDEMFDDMDMVGEADFNFFDEPDVPEEESNVIQHTQPQRPPTDKEVNTPSVEMPNVLSPANRCGSPEEDRGESDGKEQGTPPMAGSSNKQIISNTEDVYIPTEENDIEDVPCPSDSDYQQQIDKALAGRAREIPKNMNINYSKRGSFDPVWSNGLELDHKYVDQGRFGHPPEALPNSGMTLSRERDNNLQIPRLGLNHRSLSSPDSNSTNDDEHDDNDKDDIDKEDDGDDDKDDNNEDNEDDEGDDQNYHHMEQSPNHSGYIRSGNTQRMSNAYTYYPMSAANESISMPGTPASPELGSHEDGPFDFPPISFFSAATGPILGSSILPAPTADRPFSTNKEHIFIQVAQLLADQVVREYDRSSDLRGPSSRFPGPIASCYQEFLRPMLSRMSPSIEACSLSDLVRDNEGKTETMQNIMKLEGLHLRVQRMGTMADILPSAIPLWEGLSLCPSSGPKDVYAFFLFPDMDHLVQPSRVFMEMIKDAYQTCNLGAHDTDDQQSTYPLGLVPIPVTVENTREAIARLGKHLAGLRFSRGNFIIYILDTSDDVKSLPGHCTAFLNLFQRYRLACEDEDLRDPNDLALQIVPSSIVFAINKLVLPIAADYKRLAFQVYDRCGPTRRNGEEPVSPFDFAPAICLSKPIPSNVDFILAPETSSTVLDQEDCLHLAYKWESGKRWLTASWTNNLGTIHWNAAYWLSKDVEVENSFPKVAVAMLEVTTRILHKCKVPYKIAVAKYGTFKAHEIEAWSSCRVEGTPKPAIILLQVDPEPTLKLFPFNLPIFITELADLPTTPVSTPLATGQSPDTSMQHTALTNAGPQFAPLANNAENDTNARLIDITEETWAIITEKTKVQGSDSPYTKSNLTGFLVKRAGTRDEDGLLLVQVDNISGEGFQLDLMGVLKMYRDLATLARVRNIVDSVYGTLPVHIAAAGEAHAALCRSMYYAL